MKLAKEHRLLAFGAALAVGACSSSSSSTPAAASDASAQAPDASGGKLDSPATLRQFESGAEAMSEGPRGVLPGHVPDWAAAQAAYDADFALWQTGVPDAGIPPLRPTLVAAGVPTATLTAIDAALAAYKVDLMQQDQRAAENDGNKITKTVPDAFDYFTYGAPSDTLRLDGTFRQLQIDAEYSDWAACANDLRDTQAVWANLKSKVAAKAPSRPDITGSATVVADVDATLQAAQALIADDGGMATDVASLEVQAQKGLDETDTCEQVFK